MSGVTRVLKIKRPLLRSYTTTGADTFRPRTSPLFKPNEPYTRHSLGLVKSALASYANKVPSAWKEKENEAGKARASVLLALCNVDDRPGVLLEVRGKLRSHSGEISFPGGRVDETDASAEAAALREAQEEIGVEPSQVEILGRLYPTVPSLHGMMVTCFVGFIHALDGPSSQSSLGSVALSSLRSSPPEVTHLFHLPLSHLVDNERLRRHRLANRPPYWAIDVSELVPEDVIGTSPAGFSGVDEVGASGDPNGQRGKVEVWGLTAWFLNDFMKRMKVY